ncbi:MAG: multidrug ABC transporter permease [Herpetosiphonaceae bacterium]|nr:MAG: multidrug ABC transporter permease [Herpetosiphonaceae bacterium]
MSFSGYLALYWEFLIQRFKILLEYQVNFLIGVASTFFLQATGLLAIWIVMRQVPLLAGWSFNQILLIYGLVTIASSINQLFADNLWIVGSVYIRTSQFDRFLVRPINPLFHLLADRFNQDGIGNLLIGLLLLIKALVALEIALTPLKLLYLIVAILSGGAIFIGLNLLTAVSAFWVIDSVPVTRAIFETHTFAKYPLSIYGRGITLLMTWLIPYGFTSFYPASYLLGRDVGLLAWGGPLAAVTLLLIGYYAWQFGMRHYSSTGS